MRKRSYIYEPTRNSTNRNNDIFFHSSVFIYSITNIEKLARVFLMLGSLMATGKMFSLDL